MNFSEGSVELDRELGAALLRIFRRDDKALRLEAPHQKLQVARQQNRLLPKLMHRRLLKNLKVRIDPLPIDSELFPFSALCARARQIELHLQDVRFKAMRARC